MLFMPIFTYLNTHICNVQQWSNTTLPNVTTVSTEPYHIGLSTEPYHIGLSTEPYHIGLSTEPYHIGLSTEPYHIGLGRLHRSRSSKSRPLNHNWHDMLPICSLHYSSSWKYKKLHYYSIKWMRHLCTIVYQQRTRHMKPQKLQV